MIYIGDLANSRDNNFNLIRMIAASAVLVSHAYPISLGPETQEPLKALTGHTLGALSVFAFFVISGFLITASFERSRTLKRFMMARILRLYPGLIVSLVLVMAIMGPLVTTLSPQAYFTDPDSYSFLIRNLLLIRPQYTLPGVFQENPYSTVEGSIWTLFYEVACYGGVLIVGVLGLLRRRSLMAGAFAVYVALWLATHIMQPDLPYQVATLIRMAMPFAVGMGFFLWRAHIPLSVWGVVATSALAWLSVSSPVYDICLMLALAYTLFWLSYIPKGMIRAYNEVGDYSYGIYIYAFPLQGLAVWLFGPMTPLQNMLIAFPITLLPAIISWHWIEKPALALLQRQRTGHRRSLNP